MISAIHASHIFNILTCNSYTEYILLTVVDIYQSISDHIWKSNEHNWPGLSVLLNVNCIMVSELEPVILPVCTCVFHFYQLGHSYYL